MEEWSYEYVRNGDIIKKSGKTYEVLNINVLDEEINNEFGWFYRDYILKNVDDPNDVLIVKVRNEHNLPLFCKKMER